MIVPGKTNDKKKCGAWLVEDVFVSLCDFRELHTGELVNKFEFYSMSKHI